MLQRHKQGTSVSERVKQSPQNLEQIVSGSLSAETGESKRGGRERDSPAMPSASSQPRLPPVDFRTPRGARVRQGTGTVDKCFLVGAMPPRGGFGGWLYYQTLSDFFPKHSEALLFLLNLHLLRKLRDALALFGPPFGDLGVLRVHEPSLSFGLERHGVASNGPRMAYKASGESGRV